jgi:hypothetical protein
MKEDVDARDKRGHDAEFAATISNHFQSGKQTSE